MIRFITGVTAWIGISLIAILAAAALADSPTTSPAPTASLGKGRLAYTPPDGWELVRSASNDTTAAYISPDHVGILAIQLLPADAVVDSAAGPAIIRQLKANHVKAKQKMLLAPTIEKDPHFSLRIHERYDDAEGNVNDELHLYNKVGPLKVMLTVNARTEDADAAKKTHAIGEEILQTAKAVKKK
jgi:hypothetical protein